MTTKPATPRLAKVNFSFSRMNKFDSCPLQYEAQYLRHLPEIPSTPMENGKRLHTIIENYRLHLQAKQIASDPDVIRGLIDKAYIDDPEAKTTDGYRDVFFGALAFAKHYRHNFETTLGMETFCSRHLGEFFSAYDVTIIGYPDYLYWEAPPGDPDPATFDFRKLVVSRDAKTGWDATLNNSHKFQGEVMDWMLAGSFPDNPVAYEVEFTRHNILAPRITIQPIDMDRIEARIRTIVTRALRSEMQWRNLKANAQTDEDPHLESAFPAHPGGHCKFCPVATRCAKRNVLVRDGVMVDTEETAREALRDLVILDAAATQRQKQLQEFAKVYGPVLDNGIGGGYFSSEGVALDNSLEAKKKMIAELGLDEALKLFAIDGNKTKTKKVQGDARLRDFWVPKHATRWAIREVDEVRLAPLVIDENAEGAELETEVRA